MKLLFFIVVTILLEATICIKVNVNVKQKEPSIDMQRKEEDDKSLVQTLGGNSLFNQISGFETTGGIIGNFLSYISDKVEHLSGLNEFENDSLV